MFWKAWGKAGYPREDNTFFFGAVTPSDLFSEDLFSSIIQMYLWVWMGGSSTRKWTTIPTSAY